MHGSLAVLLAVGAWFTAASLILAVQCCYYRVRRYRCPACGQQGLQFVVLRSSPWVRTFPTPSQIRRYTCDQCAMAFREVDGEWERE